MRLVGRPPTTPTNKVLARTLVHEKFRSDRVGATPSTSGTGVRTASVPFGATEESRSCTKPSRRAAAPTAWDL